MPPSQLSVSGIRGQKRQLWATQTMQDVISAKAFEQWTKDQTIPRTPDDIWSASDMRKAHTFKKRQWKLSKPDFKHLKLDTITPTASHKQARQIEASATQQNQQRVAGQARNEVVSEVKQEVERPSATGPKLQAQSQARAGVLNEAFRGLLSPAQQRRAASYKGPSFSKDSYVSEILLTKRIMNMIAMHESGGPCERIYELLKPYQLSRNGKSDMAIAREYGEQVDGKNRVKENQEKSMVMLESGLHDQFSKWKTAAQELKEAVEMKWPEESKKRRMKVAIEQEMEEIWSIEKIVQEIVVE
jgi:hypothetical protein